MNCTRATKSTTVMGHGNGCWQEGAMARRTPEDRAGLPLTLPAELTQARRFGKTRTAQSTAVLEDYVELIADLLATAGEARTTDIARRLGVSHPTAINAIAGCDAKALATGRPYRGVFLTEKGQALAKRVRARHRLSSTCCSHWAFPPKRPRLMPKDRTSRLRDDLKGVRSILQSREKEHLRS